MVSTSLLLVLIVNLTFTVFLISAYAAPSHGVQCSRFSEAPQDADYCDRGLFTWCYELFREDTLEHWKEYLDSECCVSSEYDEDVADASTAASCKLAVPRGSDPSSLSQSQQKALAQKMNANRVRFVLETYTSSPKCHAVLSSVNAVVHPSKRISKKHMAEIKLTPLNKHGKAMGLIRGTTDEEILAAFNYLLTSTTIFEVMGSQ